MWCFCSGSFSTSFFLFFLSFSLPHNHFKVFLLLFFPASFLSPLYCIHFISLTSLRFFLLLPLFLIANNSLLPSSFTLICWPTWEKTISSFCVAFLVSSFLLLLFHHFSLLCWIDAHLEYTHTPNSTAHNSTQQTHSHSIKRAQNTRTLVHCKCPRGKSWPATAISTR